MSVPLMKLDLPSLGSCVMGHLVGRRRSSNENINTLVNENNINAKNESSSSSHDDLTLHGSTTSSVKYQVRPSIPTINQRNLLLNYRSSTLVQTQNMSMDEKKVCYTFCCYKIKIKYFIYLRIVPKYHRHRQCQYGDED